MGEEVLQLIKEWSPVLLPILTLLAGTGWLQYYLKRRESRRQEQRSVLRDFLVPLRSIVESNQSMVENLNIERELLGLSDKDGLLQTYLSDLPENPLTRALWKSRIDAIVQENRRALELMNKGEGSIVTEEFRQVCSAFRKQAQEWNANWEGIISFEDDEVSFAPSSVERPPRFPANFYELLDGEIRVVEKKAGL
jgi:hypothetical protein